MKKLGKYEVLGELGHGAMGVVYRARDPFINRLVALKTITAGVTDDPAMLQRFYREAQSAGGLQHPNIVTIYDMGETGALPYIAMELVDGENLEQVIARRSALPITLKLVYAMQACRAFDYAHKRGIVHRDIKPGNVMVSKDGTVKVVDFGIARVLETSRTQTGMLIGTFAYMSPEQYHGEHADERSDIWSFGVLFYELLTYQKPFTGPTPASLMHSICNNDPIPLSGLLPECPKELEVIVTKMLRKSPSERYQSMEDVLLDFEPVCKTLQAQSVADLLEQSRQLFKDERFVEARDLARQALQLESGNQEARALLEKANAELKRILNRPKAQRYVEKGQALLQEGKLLEAKVEAENALQLDSSFVAAEDLQRAILNELERARLIAEWLETAKQHLAEGLPDDAETLLARILEAEPSNPQAQNLRQLVLKERVDREKGRRLQEGLQRARELWTRQNYGYCLNLLQDLQHEFPAEEEVSRLFETVREDQVEQHKQQGLLQSRNLLTSGRHEDALTLLSDLQVEFPSDEEIPRLMEEVRKDQMNQRRLLGLAEARSLLAAGQYDSCISLLTSLSKSFPDEREIPALLETVQQNQTEQLRQRGVTEAGKLLAARQYKECTAFLTALEKQFPGDEEILILQKAVHEEQLGQEKQQRLEEARSLLSDQRYDECSALLVALEKQFPGDGEILRLHRAVQEDRSKQRRLQGLEEARRLLVSKNYEQSVALLAALRQEFPEDDDTRRLLESARKEHTDERKRDGLAQARRLLGEGQFDKSIALLSRLQADFLGETEINKLLATARDDLAEQQKQQKLAEARGLLAEQSFGDALRLLNNLAATHPKDSAVAKLRALVQREQEEHAKAEKVQRELDALKKLMSEKQYPEVISRARELLIEFPSDTNFIRLAEFAVSRQANIEKELLLKKTLEDAKAFFDAGRFDTVIRVVQNGLKTFPANAELQSLYEQSEIQQKKLQVRQKIEQRVREIRVKINREELSDAIDLAKQTLMTLGPDTDLTHLLNSAEVEFQARGKKRIQEGALETIRTLMESGDLDAANRTIDEDLESNTLDAFDPRVQRLSELIKDAKTALTEKTVQGPLVGSPSLSKEYAFLQAPPLPDAPPSPKTPLTDPVTAQLSASPTALPQYVAPKPVEPGPASTGETVVQPVPQSTPEDEPAPVAPGMPVFQPDVHQAASTAVAPVTIKAPAKEQPASVPTWRRPVILAFLTLAIISAVWAGLRSRSVKPRLVGPAVTKPTPLPSRPPVDPLETAQRHALDIANNSIAANDLDQAVGILQQAVALGGPLTPEIQKKLSEIEESKNDANLRQLRQQEAEFWKQAMRLVADGRYTDAQKDLRKILALPAGGVHRDDAQRYLDKTIPQQQAQNKLLSQARQSLAQGDFQSARGIADEFKQNGADPTQLIADIDRAEQTVLRQLESQFDQLKQRDDDAAIQQLKALQQKFQGLAGAGGPESGEALNYANNIPGTIADIRIRADKKRTDAAFQQIEQKYRQASANNDKNGLVDARGEFQLIVQNGGSHADSAQQYLAEINKKLDALNTPPPQPLPSQPPPPAIKDERNTAVADEATIRGIVQQFFLAMEQKSPEALRQVWPSIPQKRYDGYKGSFENVSTIAIQIVSESVKISPNGTTATVSVQSQEQETPAHEKKPRKFSPSWTFQLAKRNGTWHITDVL